MGPGRGKNQAFGFCKTNHRPYDRAVTAVLLRCHLLAPGAFTITSDGDWDQDWRQARTIVETLFPTPGTGLSAEPSTATCPFTEPP